MTFEELSKVVGRDEVAVAALFYGQAKASAEDIKNLSDYFGIDHATLEHQLSGFPDRGKSVEMPPKEPLIYRLYEIVQNYGYAYKAVLNEKFGDGIMSAISFSTHVEKEVDKDGVTWVGLSLRRSETRKADNRRSISTFEASGCHFLASRNIHTTRVEQCIILPSLDQDERLTKASTLQDSPFAVLSGTIEQQVHINFGFVQREQY